MRKLIILTIILFTVQFLAPLFGQIKQKPELVVQTGHTMQVYSMAFSPDGKTLASCSWDRTIKLWDVETGRQVKIFEDNAAPIYAVIFSPDGKTLASASDSGKVILWNVATGEKIETFEINSTPTSLTQDKSFSKSIAFSPDGEFLASGSYRNIKLWNIETGKQMEITANHGDYVSSISFSPDGRTLASGSKDNMIKIWDVETGQIVKAFEVYDKRISFLIFSPDGKNIISVTYNTVIFWNVETGQQIDFLRTSPDWVVSTDSSINVSNTLAQRKNSCFRNL